jgi:hypothetical protein
MGLINFFIVIGFLSYGFIRLGIEDNLKIWKFKVEKKLIWISVLVWIYLSWGIANLIYAIIN